MILMAMDRAPSVRRFDQQGFLHVGSSTISKAQIRPYFGREIPGWEALGLDANRAYKMYCSADELSKAAHTFNNLPILNRHVPINADSIPDDAIVGSMGTDCAFDGTYLRGSQVIWKRPAIKGVLSNRQRENSCGYSYTADMTPGNFEGMQFDGAMLNLAGNHVTIVVQGRAGPDVLVGDEIMKLNSRTALLIGGSIASLVRPLLAKDAKVDITDALGDVTGAGMADASLAMDQSIADKVLALVTPHLAQDQTLSADDIKDTINLVPIVAEDDDISEPAAEPKPKPRPKPIADHGGGSGGITQAAMDAAIAEAVNATATRLTAESAAIRTAEKAVQPFVGELAAMDSAAGYYEAGLKHFKVDTANLPEEAYAATFNAISKATPKVGERPAMDAAPIGAGKLLSIVPHLPPVKVA